MFKDICKTLSLDPEEFSTDEDGCYIFEIPNVDTYTRIQTLLSKNYEEDFERGIKTFESSVDIYYDSDDTDIQLNADMDNGLYKLVIKEDND